MTQTAGEQIQTRRGAGDQTGGGGQRREFTIGAKRRLPFERALRDLAAIKYLGRGPDSVDGDWDPGSQAAEDEFHRIEEFPGISEQLLQQLIRRYRDISYDIDMVDEGGHQVYQCNAKAYVPLYEQVQVRIRREGSGRQVFHIKLELDDGGVFHEQDVTLEGSQSVQLGCLSTRLEGRRLDVDNPGKVTVTTTVTTPSGETRQLERVKPVVYLTFQNVFLVQSDEGTSNQAVEVSHWISEAIKTDFLAMKEEINGLGGKLGIVSSIRTWSEQVRLWKLYKKLDPSQKNPAAQPGRSWHHTGRALDLNVWGLNIKPDTGNHRSQISKLNKQPNVEFTSDDDPLFKAAMYFHEQLQEARAIFLRHHFKLCAASWHETPWNKGFLRRRHAGTIASAEPLYYKLRFAVTRRSHPNKPKIGATAGTFVLAASADQPESQLSISSDSQPKWIADRTIEWRVPNGQITDAVLQRFTTGTIRLDWQVNAKTAGFVEARGVEIKVDAVRLTWDSANGALPQGDSRIPIAERIELRGSGKFMEALSAPNVDASRTRATIDLGMSVLTQAFGKQFDYTTLPQSAGSFVTEDRTRTNGQYLPAFQHAASEKHHYQNESPPLGNPPALQSTVDRMNAAVDTFNAALAALPAQWSAAHEGADAPPAVKKLAGHWKMSKYSITDPVVRASADIGNFPQPDVVEEDLRELARKIGEAAMAMAAGCTSLRITADL
jgi:hypothetical protein